MCHFESRVLGIHLASFDIHKKVKEVEGEEHLRQRILLLRCAPRKDNLACVAPSNLFGGDKNHKITVNLKNKKGIIRIWHHQKEIDSETSSE